MTVWVCKNWLFSIRNAAMQHLLLSQRHQKFPYSHGSFLSAVYVITV